MRDRLIELLTRQKGMTLPIWLADQTIEILADYLLLSGVIVPPCKVGDKIYQTDGIRIYESAVQEVTYCTNKVIYCTENICFDETAIGKSVFLTREEAERSIERRCE